MLAFNLGVFFRNLKGEEVAFTAETAQGELHFTGGVTDLQETTDLTRHLSVTLSKGDLSLGIAFEESEEEEPEDTEVEVELKRRDEDEEFLLLRTSFRFGDISLKPASEIDGPEAELTSADTPDDEPEPA